MIKTCRQNGLQVKIAAPTGKAASVLSAKLGGLEVKTLHSLLGMSPTEKVSQFAGDDVGLDCDVLFVDEMSMVDSEMFLQLMRSLYSETHIFFIGDVNQIDPIGPGAPFADMLHNIPTATLTEIVRQQAGNGIISFASSILASKWETPVSDVEFVDSKRPHEDAFELFGTFDLNTEAQDVMILCPVRDPKFDSSITKLNQRISQARGLERIDENFAIGDVIQFTSNTKEYGFVNGERGVIEKYEKNGARSNEVIIRNTNDRVYRLHNYSLAKHAELGYATTVHKAQGSECKTVILLLPREAQHMLTEQLLYTAVTRAKERLIVIGEKSLIKHKVTQRRIWRQTVLWGFLTGVIEHTEPIHQPLLEHYL
jgi:exodeoxyribonuclease V alpha subunit